MNEVPSVSVIIPVYNVEVFLKKCLYSVEDQTLGNLEIIIINDGSTDNSDSIIQDFKQHSKRRITYIQKENSGLSDARNTGMQYATGEYICFLDSDDYIEKDMYKKMYDEAKSNDYDLISCNFYWVYPNKQIEDKGIPSKTKGELLIRSRVVAWNKLIKRSIIVENNITFPKGLQYEDIDFFYRLVPHLNKFSLLEETFVYYMQRNQSISNTQNEKTAHIFDILENVEKYYKECGYYELYQTELEYNYARYLLCSSFKRILKIPDNSVRKNLIQESWTRLNEKYPDWQKNKILKTENNSKSKYMRTVNRFTYRIYAKILRLF